MSYLSESVSDFVPFRPIFNFCENAIQPRKIVLLIDGETFNFSVPAASTLSRLENLFQAGFLRIMFRENYRNQSLLNHQKLRDRPAA